MSYTGSNKPDNFQLIVRFIQNGKRINISRSLAYVNYEYNQEGDYITIKIRDLTDTSRAGVNDATSSSSWEPIYTFNKGDYVSLTRVDLPDEQQPATQVKKKYIYDTYDIYDKIEESYN